MYLTAREHFGDPHQGPAPVPLSRRGTMRPRVTFMTMDAFCYNDATLTQRMVTQVADLVTNVKASLGGQQPIRAIRLVGHTDCTGTEKYNQGLGDRRAVAVQAELERQLRAAGLWGQVFIVVDPSPGETRPVADNMTLDGRAANRRVEVFLDLQAAPPKPPPPLPGCPPYCPPPPPDDPYHLRDRNWGRRPAGKSFQQVLQELCTQRLSERVCKELVKRVVNGGCDALEEIFVRAGGSLSDAQKDDLRQQCRAAANKPM